MSRKTPEATPAPKTLATTPRALQPSPLSLWLQAIRPKTLAASFGPVLVASALAAAEAQFRPTIALSALLGALFLQIGTNFFNDYEDFRRGADTAERLGPARATQRGWVKPGTMLVATCLAFFIATGFGVYLVSVGGWPILVLGLLSLVCGFAYTGGPYPLAYTGLADLFVMLFFGNAAVCATYYLQTKHVSIESFLISMAIGALATAILVVNNLRDQQTDAKVGKRTLVVRFGQSFGRAEFAVMVFLPYILLAVLWAFRNVSAWWLLPWLSLPLAVSELLSICQKQPAELNEHLGKTARLGAVYALLLGIGILL